MPPIELLTRLSRADCLERLYRASTTEDWIDDPWGSAVNPAIWIRGTRLRVMHTSDDDGWRPFRRQFEGAFVDGADGTMIRGRFRLPGAARAALSIWFGSMMAIVLLLGVGLSVTGDGVSVASWTTFAAAVLMLGSGVLLFRWSVAQSRARETAVVEFLRHLLDASPTE